MTRIHLLKGRTKGARNIILRQGKIDLYNLVGSIFNSKGKMTISQRVLLKKKQFYTFVLPISVFCLMNNYVVVPSGYMNLNDGYNSSSYKIAD